MRRRVVGCLVALVLGVPVGVWALTDTVQVWWAAHAYVREHVPDGRLRGFSWVDPNDDQAAVGLSSAGEGGDFSMHLSRRDGGWAVDGLDPLTGAGFG